MELLHKAHNIEIYYDSIGRCLYCSWIGYQPHQDLVHSGFIIMELLRRKRVVKVLNDNSRVEGPWTDSSAWTANKWFPCMASAGLQHFSWILSPDVFAEVSALKALPMHNLINIQLFDSSSTSFEGARDWLRQQPNTNVFTPAIKPATSDKGVVQVTLF